MIKSDVVQRVSTALAEDERTAKYDISVIDKQGVVTLTGVVATEEAKTAAEEIAEAQPGVLEVINDLEIEAEGVAEDFAAHPPDVRGGLSRST